MNDGPASRSDGTFGSVFVYAGACLALGALAWSLVVAAGRPRVRIDAKPAADHAGMAAPPVSAVLMPAIGAVRDAALLNGAWYVLDRTDAKVHRIDATGTHLGSFAGAGDGPGELRAPRAIAVHADSVVVGQWRSLVLYAPDGGSIARRRIEPPDGCAGPSLADLATSPAGLLLLITCDRGGEFEAVVVKEAGPAGPQLVATRGTPPGDERALTAFRHLAVLAGHPKGFVFGHPNDECLEILDFAGQVADSVCHSWIPRQPYAAGEDEGWREIHAAARSLGVAVRQPEFYPPFHRVFVGDDGELVYSVQVPGRVEQSRLWSERDARRTLTEMPAGDAVFLEGASALAVWYEPDGTWIKVYDASDG